MKVPCKDCLILPICKNREEVICELLFQWWIDKKGIGKWEYLSKYIPNIVSIGDRDKASFSRELTFTQCKTQCTRYKIR